MSEQEILDLINANEVFPYDQPADKKFTSQDLDSNGRLYVPDVLPGSINVVDSLGNLVLVDQIEKLDSNGACVGVYLNLNGFEMEDGSIWKVRYNRGMRGFQGTGTVSSSSSELSQETMLYAILFS